jgi:hypothetical protein
MALVAQVLGQLGRHRPLHQPAREIGQQATWPDDLLLGPRAREQLVDQLVAEPLTNLRREPRTGRALRPARRAGVSLRSPSGLAPLTTGARSITSMLVCDSFEVGMTLQFGHAYTDPRTLPSSSSGAHGLRHGYRKSRIAIVSTIGETARARPRQRSDPLGRWRSLAQRK